MRWSASALVADCAYRTILKRAKPKSERSQVAIAKGVTFHTAIDAWFVTGVLPQVEDMEIQGWLDLLVSQLRQPPFMVRSEVAWGLGIYGQHVHVEEPEPHIYRSMDGSELLTAGRADAAWFFGEGLRCIDWKTGAYPVTPAHDNLQALASSMALADRWKMPAYQPGIYYARDGAWDWGDVIQVDSPEHERAFAAVKAAAELDETPRPGPHCGGCWERKTCAPGAAFLGAP